MFDNNVGESGVIFTNDQPYFQSYGKTKKLDAEINYGLKSATKILTQDGLPARLHMNTKEDYLNWWDDQVKERGVNDTDFVVNDYAGVPVVFKAKNGKTAQNYFRDHILKKKAEKRFEYAANAIDMLTIPDEVWFKDDAFHYVKYYNEGMYVFTVLNNLESVWAKTL